MNGDRAERIKRNCTFIVNVHGNKTKIYTVDILLGILIIHNYLHVSSENLSLQVNKFNGVILDEKIIFLNRKDAVSFKKWIDSIVMLKILGGNNE
jgi:hypothetical protein